jgi:hypothetical protein
MQTNRKNINPSMVDDKRTNFLVVRLVAAASSAHPTKYAQNKCAGIQDGTKFATCIGPSKCSGANTASGTAMKIQPKVMSLSQPRAALISFRSIKTPATREISPAKHIQKFTDESIRTSCAKVLRQSLYPVAERCEKKWVKMSDVLSLRVSSEFPSLAPGPALRCCYEAPAA